MRIMLFLWRLSLVQQLKPLRWWSEKMKFKYYLGRSAVASVLLLGAIIYGRQTVMKLKHFQNISGLFLHSKWTNILEFFGNDEFYLYVLGNMLCILIPFWTIGGIFTFMDYFNWPKWVRKYKVQPGTNEPVDLNKLKETIKVVVINQWTTSIPLLFISYAFKKITNTMPGIYELPTLQRFLIEMTVLFIWDEIALYYVHRLLHHPKLYASVHKKHHEWHAPIALSVLYTTKTENMMITAGTAVGPFLMNPHLATLYTWYALIHVRGLKNHSGYDFPWLPTPEDHDYHHMMNNACFGRTLCLDWLHGTDKGFRAYQARKNSARQSEHFTKEN